MAEPYKIYTLHDPDTMAVRYVGFTSKTLTKRLASHIAAAKYKFSETSHRINWIRSLLLNGKSPTILLVETVSSENWKSREKFWISHFRKNKCHLTNSCDGGDGIVNPSPETRARLRAANLGKTHSKESRAKMSAAHIGKVSSNETKAKIGAANRGRSHSDQAREKMSAANRGKTIPMEVREKMRAAHIGKTIPKNAIEKIAAALRKPVVDISTGIEFPSLKSAAAAFGVTRTAVAYWIKTGKFAYANNQPKEVIMT